MTKHRKAPYIIGIAIALSALTVWGIAWTDTKGGGALLGPSENADLSQLQRKLADAEERHREQIEALEQRLDQLVARSQPDPVAIARVRQERAEHREQMADPVQRAAFQRKALKELQDDFNAEQVDPYWASTTSAFIGDALKLSRELSNVNPRNSDVECRSQRCRISFEVDASAEAEDFMMPLVTNLTETLAKTKAVEVISADGKHIEMHVFAEQWSSDSNNRSEDG